VNPPPRRAFRPNDMHAATKYTLVLLLGAGLVAVGLIATRPEASKLEGCTIPSPSRFGSRPEIVHRFETVPNVLLPERVLPSINGEDAVDMVKIVSFQLGETPTQAVWPASEHWHLSGYRFLPDVPGVVAIQVTDARRDQELVSAEVRCDQAPIQVIVAFSFEPVNGTDGGLLGLYQLAGAELRKLRSVSIPPEMAPSKRDEESLGWRVGIMGYQLQEGSLDTYSWNGLLTDLIAQRAGGSIHIPPEAEETWETFTQLELKDWPEPVWFVQMRFTPQ